MTSARAHLGMSLAVGLCALGMISADARQAVAGVIVFLVLGVRTSA